LASAYLKNSFGIFSRSFSFANLVLNNATNHTRNRWQQVKNQITKKNMDGKIENILSYEDMKRTITNDNYEFIILPNLKDIGVIDFHKSSENLSIIIQKAKLALEQEFFIEFISLKIQYLEYYLKIYWVTKNPNNKVFDENSRKQFGTLIQECKDYGFE
jgi:hypothetical protein